MMYIVQKSLEPSDFLFDSFKGTFCTTEVSLMLDKQRPLLDVKRWWVGLDVNGRAFGNLCLSATKQQV